MGLISRVSSRTYRQKTHLFTMAEFARALQTQNIWVAAQQYKEAEEKLIKQRLGLASGDASAPAEAAPASPVESKASAMIADLKKELTSDSKNSIQDVNSMLDRVVKLEQKNNEIKAQLQAALARLDQLEAAGKSAAAPAAAPVAAVCPAKKEEPAKKAESEDDDDDCSDFDFDSESEDEEEKAAAEALKAKRVAEYNARKAEKAAKKGVVAAKSMITLDVKPFDDETDLDALALKIKSEIAMDGLVWGQKHEKKPLAFGIFKLVITAVVEDEKVSTDDLTEKIEEYDDEVQSVDIAAFNKL